ncbi:hypothetical protein [Paraburkholderia phenazinium]|uniref:Uncharacterized protein n=1 Tax=Paraburkholderia phenazinium TaxID=60549 RepID=A0A1N6KP51_9BURK|nr:hypothetical protein [Paraburkholderia phenazinium]SIO58318.1 hypothetical protein SAMN05444165_4100 [Paraburkholderia phenazinium]
MSVLAKDLFELQRLASGGAGALTEHLLKEVAADIISEGVDDELAATQQGSDMQIKHTAATRNRDEIEYFTRAGKCAVVAMLFAASVTTHASVARGQAGRHGASLGSTAHAAAATSGAAAAPGRVSLVEGYQPWPQAEMQQFAKPKFVPYDGR